MLIGRMAQALRGFEFPGARSFVGFEGTGFSVRVIEHETTGINTEEPISCDARFPQVHSRRFLLHCVTLAPK